MPNKCHNSSLSPSASWYSALRKAAPIVMNVGAR